MKRIYFIFLYLFVAASFLFPASPAYSETIQEREIEKYIKEHPKLIIDILKNYSEELLDIVQDGADKRRHDSLIDQWKTDAKIPKKYSVLGRALGGSANAPITLVAFTDIICTYCKEASFTVANLMRKHKGQIRLLLKFVPKNEAGRIAAKWFLTAYSLDQMKAWKLYALAFDRQYEVDKNPEEMMKLLAKQVGFDIQSLQSAVRSRSSQLDKIIDEDEAEAKALGFVGTPYFLVNNLIIRGALSLDNFEEAVNIALKQKKD